MNLDIIEQDFNPASISTPFSVCMTVLNEASGMYNFLVSVFAQTKPPADIVIVDAGSTDNTLNAIRGFRDLRINLIVINGILPAAARNLASKSARHEIQVMVDAGTILHKDLFANLVGPMVADNPPDIVAGVYGPITPSKWARYFIPDWKGTRYLNERFLPSCRNSVVTRKLVNRVGGFDEGFKYKSGEDTLFMMRAKDVSKRWGLNKKAYVSWEAPTTEEEAIQLAYHYGIGNGQVGCDLYQSNKPPENDRISYAAYMGYLKGLELRAERNGHK